MKAEIFPRMMMPTYVCHKTVRALKLARVELLADRGVLTPENATQGFTVSLDYMKKHNPQPGGYYIIYADNYESFSPAAAFEKGYTLVPSGQVMRGPGWEEPVPHVAPVGYTVSCGDLQGAIEPLRGK